MKRLVIGLQVVDSVSRKTRTHDDGSAQTGAILRRGQHDTYPSLVIRRMWGIVVIQPERIRAMHLKQREVANSGEVTWPLWASVLPNMYRIIARVQRDARPTHDHSHFDHCYVNSFCIGAHTHIYERCLTQGLLTPNIETPDPRTRRWC